MMELETPSTRNIALLVFRKKKKPTPCSNIARKYVHPPVMLYYNYFDIVWLQITGVASVYIEISLFS